MISKMCSLLFVDHIINEGVCVTIMHIHDAQYSYTVKLIVYSSVYLASIDGWMFSEMFRNL